MEYEPQTESQDNLGKYLEDHGYTSIQDAIYHGANLADLCSLLNIEPLSMDEEAISLGGKVIEYNGL